MAVLFRWLPVFHHLRDNLKAAFRLRWLPFHLLAVAITVSMVLSGIDKVVRDWTVALQAGGRDPIYWTLFQIGEWWHVALGLLLVIVGRLDGRRGAVAAGAAILQALLLTAVIVLFLKLATGRPTTSMSPDATEFHWLRFGFGTLYVMWPSGHTAVGVATAASVQALVERRWLAWPVWLGALFNAASMLMGNFHWLSDIIAGALIAFPIGWCVGRGFRDWEGLETSQS